MPALLLLLLSAFFLILIRLTNSRNRRQLRLPPSPPRLPVLGNLHQLSSLPHQSLRSLSRRHGPLMLLKLGQVPTLVVSSAAAAREVMRTHDHVFASRPSLKAARILLYGGRDVALSPYGEHWRQIRKLCVNHLLNPKILQSLRPVLDQEVALMVSDITEMSISPAGRHGINMSRVLNLFVNKYLCRILFGDSFRDDARCGLLCKMIGENSATIGELTVGDYIPALGWLDTLSGFSSRANKLREKWDALFEEIVGEHAERSRADAEQKLDFVDALLAVQGCTEAEFTISRETIKAIMLDMIVAGTDTTTVVLDWGMAELIRNPEAMMKLKDEVRSMAAASGPVITSEDLERMSYLKAVIKETLRLHPPVPLLLPRESMDHCVLQGYDIPKQTRVLVNAWAIGRDPASWESPDEFRPERFIGSAVDHKGHDFQLVPFGAGRRICPGMQFASSTLELTFANLMHSFEWELPAGIKPEDIDMAEYPGLTAGRRQSLLLIAKPLRG